MSNNTVLSLRDLNRFFYQGEVRLDVLKGATLEIKAGEVVGLVGPSGCGKSTLLQLAGLLDSPNSGKVMINNIDCTNINDNERTKVRRNEIGFIYQFHHLLPEFTALENVVIPQMISGKSIAAANKDGEEILKYLGLSNRTTHKPSELSGGEQQRVAIARALVNKPSLLLADEPTGNLDPTTADSVFKLLMETAKAIGVAMFIVTHNLSLAEKMDRVVTIEGGVVSRYKKYSS